MRIFIAHNAADPVRYQLVMERPVPGFVPSEESFAIGLNTFAGTRADLEAAGVRSERAVDLFRAINNGLVGQQVANEPGGDRWTRLADEALDMFLAYWAKEDKTARKKRGTR